MAESSNPRRRPRRRHQPRDLAWRPGYVVGKVPPRDPYPTTRDDGKATTNLGRLLREAEREKRPGGER